MPSRARSSQFWRHTGSHSVSTSRSGAWVRTGLSCVVWSTTPWSRAKGVRNVRSHSGPSACSVARVMDAGASHAASQTRGRPRRSKQRPESLCLSPDGRRMRPIDRFTLEKHDGPYETWPLRSRLSLDGRPTGISLPGYTLLHQFETSNGYIVVTDYDCPFEEITNFALISRRLRLQSCRWIGWMYETFLLERIEWIDARTFTAFFHGNLCCRFTIRSWGIPYMRPRLKLQLDRSLPHGDGRVELPMGTHGIRKLANAFIPDATPTGLLPIAALSSIYRFTQTRGGVWVGGTVFVSSSGVSFVPNRANRLVHNNPEQFNVRAGDIRGVRREFGWVTGIVVVRHARGEFRFRCYGATQLAAAMAATLNVGPEPPVG